MGEVAKKKEMEKLSIQLVLSYLPPSDPQLCYASVVLVQLVKSWPSLERCVQQNYLCLAASLGAVGEVMLSSLW